MSTTQHTKIIIAGGGTGGHIFPAIAIANALKRLQPGCDILFVGANGKMEMEKVPKAGYPIVGLDIIGFNRSSLVKNIFLPFKLIRSFLQARRILQTFKPDVAVGVGGYASFPVLFMAQQKGIATVIQEQNSFAGKSNQVLGRKANKICVAYDDMHRFFPKERIQHTGNPVRQGIAASAISKEQGVAFFGLSVHRKTVFAFGGSLGAKRINETLLSHLPFFNSSGIQLIWQTGVDFYPKALAAAESMGDHIRVHAFINEMDYAYAAADIIISRAGASSISELCIVGKPVIFIPFPFASEDHQTHNAMALVKRNAAMMVKDEDAERELIPKLEQLLADVTRCTLMQENIKKMQVLSADEDIAHQILSLAQ
jgi:UDP-N-acetylglucosamine--N-acetylmuramyl-(pentapeptide) pyrophosphoryl-undecaprenol N-acetylglucosamine transferase